MTCGCATTTDDCCGCCCCEDAVEADSGAGTGTGSGTTPAPPAPIVARTGEQLYPVQPTPKETKNKGELLVAVTSKPGLQLKNQGEILVPTTVKPSLVLKNQGVQLSPVVTKGPNAEPVGEYIAPTRPVPVMEVVKKGREVMKEAPSAMPAPAPAADRLTDEELYGLLDVSILVQERKWTVSQRSTLRRLADEAEAALDAPRDTAMHGAECALCGPAADRVGALAEFIAARPLASVKLAPTLEWTPGTSSLTNTKRTPPTWAKTTGLPDPARVQLGQFGKATGAPKGARRRRNPPSGDVFDAGMFDPTLPKPSGAIGADIPPLELVPLPFCPSSEKRVKPNDVRELGDACFLRLGSEFAGLPGDTTAPTFYVPSDFEKGEHYSEEDAGEVLRTLMPEFWARIDAAEAERGRLGRFVAFRQRISREIYARSPGGLFWARSGRGLGYWGEALRLALRTIYANADVLHHPQIPMEKGGYHNTQRFQRWMTTGPDWEVRYWAKAGRSKWREPVMQLHRLPDGAVAARRWDGNGAYAYALRNINLRKTTKLEAALGDYYFWWAVRIIRYCSERLGEYGLTWGQVQPYGQPPPASFSHDQRKALQLAAHGFLVAQMSARLATRCVVDIARLLVHEMGHIQTPIRAGSSWHCKRGLSRFDCTQYIAGATFLFRVCARYGLPRGPTHYLEAHNAGVAIDGISDSNTIVWDRFLPGAPVQRSYYLNLSSDYESNTERYARMRSDASTGGTAWYQFIPSPGNCGYTSEASKGQSSFAPHLILIDDGETISLTQDEMDALIGHQLLPDQPRQGGTFGLVQQSLSVGSPVLLQHVFPPDCRDGRNGGVQFAAAWQLWVSEP